MGHPQLHSYLRQDANGEGQLSQAAAGAELGEEGEAEHYRSFQAEYPEEDADSMCCRHHWNARELSAKKAYDSEWGEGFRDLVTRFAGWVANAGSCAPRTRSAREC
jgi:hypothetical protein